MADLKSLQTRHWRFLIIAVFAIVLIVHLAIISSAKGQFSIQNSAQAMPFTTRMVELPAILPVVEKVSEVVSSPKPLKTKVAAVATPEAAPADDLASVPLPVQPTSVAEVAAPIPILTPSAPESAQEMPTATSSNSAPPPGFTALSSSKHTYKAIFTNRGITNQGNAEIQWQQDGEKYALKLTASAFMLDALTWKSTGLMSAQGLMPERFSDKRLGKSEVAAHFDRIQNQIIFSANTPEAPLQAGAQDRISVLWQLAGLLAADPVRYAPGTNIPMQMVDATEAGMWVFSVHEVETLSFENGSQIALRLTRNPRKEKEFDRKIELWFAPALSYLPVRFRQTQTNGDYFDLIWQNSQALENPPMQ